MSEFLRRLRLLFHRGSLEQDLEEEMRIHLEMHAEESRGNGMDAREAGCAARRQFGNATLLKETSREMWGWGAMERFGQDLGYALHGLRRSPGFTATAVAVVALGIGPTVAVFSVVDQMMLRPLPFPDAGKLYRIKLLDKRGAAQLARPNDLARRYAGSRNPTREGPMQDR